MPKFLKRFVTIFFPVLTIGFMYFYFGQDTNEFSGIIFIMFLVILTPVLIPFTIMWIGIMSGAGSLDKKREKLEQDVIDKKIVLNKTDFSQYKDPSIEKDKK